MRKVKLSASQAEAYYKELGVDSSATDDELKKAYRRLAQKYHPDRNTDADAHEKMSKINGAFKELEIDRKDATRVKAEPMHGERESTTEPMHATRERENNSTQQNSSDKLSELIQLSTQRLSLPDATDATDATKEKNETEEDCCTLLISLLSKLLGKNNEIKELLNLTRLSLFSVNTSIAAVLSTLMAESTAATAPVGDTTAPVGDTAATATADAGGVSLWSKISGSILRIIIAIYPVALKFIEEKRQEISDFFYPVFKFLFEGLIPFFTKTIPDFFTKDIPKYFSEKFNIVSDFTTMFIGDFKKVIAGIEKTVGETIVSIANALPDYDFLKTTKESLKKIGTDMITSSDETTKAVDEEQAKIKKKRSEKEKEELIFKLADMEGKRVVEANKALGYTGYTVIPNKEKQLITIEYTINGQENASPKVYDLKASMDSGKLEEKNSTPNVTPKNLAPETTEMPDANRASETTPPSASPAEQVSGNAETSYGGNPTTETPDANRASGTTPPSVSPAEQVSGNAETSSGGNPTPEMPKKSLNELTAGTSSGSGNSLLAASTAEKTPQAVAGPTKTPANPTQSNSKTNVLPGSGPHNISDVPDPSPYLLGGMASQLFFGRA